MKPFFSIVIPTLNEEAYLPKILDCLLKQTFKRFEVIVVDGASTDRTISKVEDYKGKFHKLDIACTVYVVKRRNVSYQRNYGASKARGNYLVFFDADVLVGKRFFDKVKAYIVRHESFLITTWLTSDSNDPLDELLVLLANVGIELARHGPKPFIPGHNIIIEHNCFKAVGGFDEKIKHAEDHHFALTAYKKGLHVSVIHDVVQCISMRRIQSEGRINVLRKYMKSIAHQILKGPIREDIFDYQMGGGYHDSVKHESFAKIVKKKISKTIPKQLRHNL